MPVTVPGVGPDLGAGPLQFVQGAAGAFDHEGAGLGGAHALAGALEQGDAEFLLQRADLPGDRGLDQVQQFRRPRDAADLGDGHERLELLHVHRCLPCIRVPARPRVHIFGGAHIRIRYGAIRACYFTEASMSDHDGITAASPRSPGQPLEVAP